MLKTLLLGALAAAALCSVPAQALDVTSGSVSVVSSDSMQLGRLSRNGVPQDFAGDEPFPGTINDLTPYFFTTVNVPFAPNASQDVFYDITVDEPGTDIFASAYLDSYDPADKALNWLGDSGTSGNYFGTDVLFYDVVVPAGHQLQLVFNSTVEGGIPTSIANYSVYAFSDNSYDENFVTVSAAPEPSTWAFMFVGLGALGASLRTRKRPGISATSS